MNLVEKLNFVCKELDDLQNICDGLLENEIYNVGRIRGMIDVIIEEIKEKDQKSEIKDKKPTFDKFWMLHSIDDLKMFPLEKYKLFGCSRNGLAECYLNDEANFEYESLVDSERFSTFFLAEFINKIKEKNVTQFCRVA